MDRGHKVTRETIAKIKKLKAMGIENWALSKRFGITESCVGQLLRRQLPPEKQPSVTGF